MVCNVALDTSAYIRPADDDDENNRFTEDKKALLHIRKLAENGCVKVYIPINVHIELNRFRAEGLDKRENAKLFWKSVEPELLPQEIGFAGLSAHIGRDELYEKCIKEKEEELRSLNDSSLDSSIVLNAEFFGMVLITTDYSRIRRIKRQLSREIRIMSPQEFVSAFEQEQGCH